MLSTQMVLVIVGILMFGLGLWGAISRNELFKQILAINIAGVGLFILFASIAYSATELVVQPIPQTMLLTAIVIAMSAIALLIYFDKKMAELK